MAKLVIVTFDLTGAKSSRYEVVRDGLAEIGLHTYVPKNGRRVRLPYNTVAGKIVLSSTAAVRDRLAKGVKALFRQHHLRGRVFIAVGGNWAWAKRVT